MLYVLYAPYDMTKLDKRAEVYEHHVNAIKADKARGLLKMSSPMCVPGTSPADQKYNGTFYIFEAESEAEVQKRVEADVYYTAKVWDLPQIKINAIPRATFPSA